MTKYTQLDITGYPSDEAPEHAQELFDEEFIAEVTPSGVYLDHNYIEGALFIDHDSFDMLVDFREDIIDEIGRE